MITSKQTAFKRCAAFIISAAVGLSATSCAYMDSITHTEITTPVRLTFSWWGSESRTDYTLQGINEYEQSVETVDIYPMPSDFVGYKENLDALMSCGKESDIIQINYAWVDEYSADGEGFYDLNELSDYIDLDNFTSAELSYGTRNGKLNAIPISLNAVTFYYNKDIFDSYGLELPKTWDDLFDSAAVLSQDGIYTLETAEIYYWLMLTAHEEQLSGKQAFSDDESRECFGKENVISMMKFYAELIREKVIPYSSFNKDDFINGSCAGVTVWVSDAEYYIEPLKEAGGNPIVGDYICADDSKLYGWYVKPTSLYAISKNTDNPEQTARFLNFLLNDSRMAKLQGTEKGIPLSNSAIETLDGSEMLSGLTYEASQKISTDTLSLMPSKLEESQRYAAFFEQFDLYYYEQKTLDQAAEDFLTAYPFS